MTESSDPTAGTPGGSSSEEFDVGTLLIRLTEAEARANASRDAHLRAVADLENVRKRSEREVGNAAKYGVEKLLGELLGIADSLDLGLAAATKPDAQAAAIAEGLQLTRKQLGSVMEKHGVKLVDPVGEPFNPELHEAVTTLETPDVPHNHVVSVMQRGYRLHDRLLRPAMVVVARAPAG